jgi:hypothetical protein
VRIVFATFGRGSGDLVIAASLYSALKRMGTELSFSAVGDCEYYYLFDDYFDFVFVKPQPEFLFRRDHETDLVTAIAALQPDVLVVWMIWLPLYAVIDQFPCKKIFLARGAPNWWWRAPLGKGRTIDFDPDHYDIVFDVEPNTELPFGEKTEPMVVRNPNEVLPREVARRELGAVDDRPLCVVAHNGYAGELEQILTQEKLDAAGYHVITLTNTQQGRNIFPLAEYARGIDFLIGGAGYNLFYEARYFGIPSRHIPFKRNGDDQLWRLETNRNYSFQENGADTVARRIIELFDERAV